MFYCSPGDTGDSLQSWAPAEGILWTEMSRKLDFNGDITLLETMTDTSKIQGLNKQETRPWNMYIYLFLFSVLYR